MPHWVAPRKGVQQKPLRICGMHFLQSRCPSSCLTNSIRMLKKFAATLHTVKLDYWNVFFLVFQAHSLSFYVLIFVNFLFGFLLSVFKCTLHFSYPTVRLIASYIALDNVCHRVSWTLLNLQFITFVGKICTLWMTAETRQISSMIN